MFSQFISPAKRMRPQPKPSAPPEQEEEYVLSLAPFTNLPKVVFDNVPLGTTCVKNLTIRNPTPGDIKLIVTRIPQNERRLELSWYEEVIRSNEDVLLELRWSAEVEGSWRDSVSFQDGGRLRKEVPVNFKCIKIKKTKPKPKPKPAVVSTKVRSPLRKKLSPAKRLSPVKSYRKPLPDITNLPTVIVTPSCEQLNVCRTDRNNDKENFFGVRCGATNVTFGMSESKLKSPVRDVSGDEFDDSLESPKKRCLDVSETLEEKIGRLALTPCLKDGEETYTKLNISSSTQIKDSTIDLTSPKSTIANCTLSPIRTVEINNRTFEMGKQRNRLGLIAEEASGDYSTSLNKTRTKTVKFAKPKPLNLKTFFEKSNVIAREPKTPVKLHDVEKIIRVQNPLVLTATNDIDPFISSSIYYNLQWVDEQEKSFKKWLNALLTPPLELNSDANIQIDVGKLWNDCKKREISKAPSRELISNTYHVKTRLDSLRKSAFNFITSSEMSEVLSKVSAIIDNNKLQIRNDRDVHLDLSLQAEIMILFISYNPLWLRIGLETIYGVTIPLNSNSDVMGLSLFISEHYFKDPYLLKKHKSLHSPKYSADIKKFVLKKFLMLIYFLDQAKSKQLIPHDPCLFSKKAPYKESREILLKFSRDLLFAVGDVTKFLRHFGYVLGHKQTYIHEFDYAVSDLGTDLRDGVRLTRVAEIILLRDGLIENLRLPAISRLQKIHNVKIVFDALTAAGLAILHDVQPKDIVDGHKEKTLSFLWQIIYKFEAPRLKKAVVTIQVWWRSLAVSLKRNALRKLRRKQLDSATKIQGWYKRILLSRMYWNLIPVVKELMVRRRMENAAVKIQSFLKMVTVRRNYLKLRTSVVYLQSHSRRWLALRRIEMKIAAIIKIQSFHRMCRERKFYLRLKTSVRTIENFYLSKKARNDYLRLRSTVSFIAAKYRANKAMKIHRGEYLKLKQATLTIQRRFRATEEMLVVRHEFLQLKISARTIQEYYRSRRAMQKERGDFLKLRSAVIFVQRKFRSKKQRRYYVDLKKSCVVIQRRFRAYLLMKKTRSEYLETIGNIKRSVRIIEGQYLSRKTRKNYLQLKQTTIFIQRKFRANKTMKIQRESYENLVCAARFVQRKFRANSLMLKEKSRYDLLKRYTMMIQARYRARKLQKIQSENFLRLKRAVVWTQRKYRAKKMMETKRGEYQNILKAVRFIQAKYRATAAAKKESDRFLRLKRNVVLIQRKFRANRLMRRQRNDYENTLKAIRFVQVKFKAKFAMRKQFNEYRLLRRHTVTIQATFRAKKQLKSYSDLKRKTIKIQRWYRSLLKMREDRNYYLKLKESTVFVQTKYKAKLLTKRQRGEFLILRENVVKIQRKFRTKIERAYYLKLKDSVIYIQTLYRAQKKMLESKRRFDALKKATVCIQRRYRELKLTRERRSEFIQLKNTCIFIQRRYRAKKLMEKSRSVYRRLREAAIAIQSRFRAQTLMRAQRKEYEDRKKAVRVIEARYIARNRMRTDRNDFEKLRRAAIKIQAYYKGYVTRKSYEKLLETVLWIQRRYRAKMRMERQRNYYKKLRNLTVCIQRRFQAKKLGQRQREEFLTLKKSVLIVEDRYVAKKLMIVEVERLRRIKNAVAIIQDHYKRTKAMLEQRSEYEAIKRSARVIQNRFRAKIERRNYLTTRRAVVKIQRWYRERRAAKNLLAIKLQARIRGFLLRRKLTEEFGSEKKKCRAAIKIQAYWRGYLVRSREEEKRMDGIRQKLTIANRKYTKQDTLKVRIEKALVVCGEHGSTYELNKALRDLDVCTRVSRQICSELCGSISEFLYDTISLATRSEPEREMLALSASILVNFWRVPEAREAAWCPDHVDAIVTKMAHWCDKDTPVFVHLCTLLWLFAHNNRCRRSVRAIPQCRQRFAKIRTLCERKHKMLGRSTSCAIVSYFGPYKKLPLPSLEPDWGIEYGSRPRIFRNSMQAIESLISILDAAS